MYMASMFLAYKAQSVRIPNFCSGPINVDPISPQPNS